MVLMRKPQVALDDDVHYLLRKYCAETGDKISRVASKVLRSFLSTHQEINSQGSMTVERGTFKTVVHQEKTSVRRESFETIVQVFKEDQGEEAKRTLLPVEIVKKGDRYIVEKSQI